MEDLKMTQTPDITKIKMTRTSSHQTFISCHVANKDAKNMFLGFYLRLMIGEIGDVKKFPQTIRQYEKYTFFKFEVLNVELGKMQKFNERQKMKKMKLLFEKLKHWGRNGKKL